MGGIVKAVGSLFSGGGSKTKKPEVVKRDPEADSKASQEKANEAASKLAAEDKKRRKSQSLLSSGGESGNANSGSGKTTLGS